MATDSQGHSVHASLWFFAVGTQQSEGKSAQLQVLPSLKQVCNMLGRRGRGYSWEWIYVQVTLGAEECTRQAGGSIAFSNPLSSALDA